MNEPWFLDANILIYAVGREHAYLKPCRAILEDVANGKITAVTDTEAFQEIAYYYWRQNKWPVATSIFKDYWRLFQEVYAVDNAVLEIYYDLMTLYGFLSPRDAIHAAVMKQHGVTRVYTADKAFGKLPFLRAFSPPRSVIEAK